MNAPIVPEQREMMNALAATLDEIFNGEERPGKVGFVLLTFNFGQTQGGRVNYISNANRADMRAAMREFIARAEGRYVEASA